MRSVQYEILLVCKCGHMRKCKPKILHLTTPRKYTAH